MEETSASVSVPVRPGARIRRGAVSYTHLLGDRPLSVPSHHEPLLVVLKLRSGDLRIFLQVGITCKLESADGILALRLLASRDDCYNGLPVGTAAVGDVGCLLYTSCNVLRSDVCAK